jgi:hypothetical protein
LDPPDQIGYQVNVNEVTILIPHKAKELPRQHLFTFLTHKNVGYMPGAGAHACNPSNSGGRDQEDHGSKPAWANNSTRPYLEKPFTKIELVQWLKVKALSLSPSTEKKKV